MSLVRQPACACRKVNLLVEKAAIVSVECYCGSCRASGLRRLRLPDAPAPGEIDV